MMTSQMFVLVRPSLKYRAVSWQCQPIRRNSVSLLAISQDGKMHLIILFMLHAAMIGKLWSCSELQDLREG